jgi:transposase
MYIETIKSVKNGKAYITHLVRETYRENGKVKHRTISNISKLPKEQIDILKKSIKGYKGEFSINDLQLGKSYEYGASYAFKNLAEQLGLDKMIHSKNEQWHNDILALIVGRLVYQGSKLSLVNMFNDTSLWSLYGHNQGDRPDVYKHCYLPMDKLLERQKVIQKKLAEKHFADGNLILYDITNTWLEGKYKNSRLVNFGKAKGGKHGYKQIALGLLTDKNGCPVAVEVFKGSTSDQTTVYDQIRMIAKDFGIKNIIFTGDRGMLTQKRIEEVNSENFKTITALTHTQVKQLIDEEIIQPGLFDEKNIAEVSDGKVRYMLCKNPETMHQERTTRRSIISTVCEKLTTKSNVKMKRDKLKVAAGVGRIFEKYKIQKFLTWDVGDNGELTWFLKEDVVAKEEMLDGCYVIRTDAGSDILTKEETVKGYRNLQKVEFAFKNIKTVALEVRPMYHKKDERLKSHIFLTMLAYYIQWNATERLAPLFKEDGNYEEQRWTFKHIVERLKSIRKTECLVNGVPIKQEISIPDAEQQRILNLLNVKMA